MLRYVVLSAFLLTALATDLRSKRIPDALSLTVFLLSFVPCLASGDVKGALTGLLTALILIVSLLPLFMLRTLGGGDVKFFAALGAWLGLKEAYVLLFTALVTAAVIGVVLIFRKNRYIRFAVPMCIAFVLRMCIRVFQMQGIL